MPFGCGSKSLRRSWDPLINLSPYSRDYARFLLIAPLIRVNGFIDPKGTKNLTQGGYHEEILFKGKDLGKREEGLYRDRCA